MLFSEIFIRAIIILQLFLVYYLLYLLFYLSIVFYLYLVTNFLHLLLKFIILYNKLSLSNRSSISNFYFKSNVSAVNVINQNYSNQSHWSTESSINNTNKSGLISKVNNTLVKFKNRFIKN